MRRSRSAPLGPRCRRAPQTRASPRAGTRSPRVRPLMRVGCVCVRMCCVLLCAEPYANVAYCSSYTSHTRTTHAAAGEKPEAAAPSADSLEADPEYMSSGLMADQLNALKKRLEKELGACCRYYCVKRHKWTRRDTRTQHTAHTAHAAPAPLHRAVVNKY